MKKRLLSVIVSLVLIVTMSVPAVAFAATDKGTGEIWGIFSECSTFKGMKAWYGDKASNPVVSDDPSGWKLQFKTGTKYIYVDVMDHLMYDLNGEAIEIEVDYYDDGEGVFTVTYDGYEDADKDAEFVDLTDTKSWKTHTFFIQDAVFKNGLKNADFRIAVSSTFLASSNSYAVRDDIVFGAVRVKRAGITSPIQMKLTTENTGNIFFEDEKIKINVDFVNKLNEEYKLNAHVEAVDIENRLLWEDKHEISFAKEEKLSRTYEFAIDRFNLYWFRVTLTDEEGKIFCIDDTEFSYVTTNHGTRLNYDVGTTTHLDRVDGTYGDVKKVVPLLVKAGYGRERYEWGWRAQFSGGSGFLVYPYAQTFLDEFKNAGVKRTIILSVANMRFPLHTNDPAYDRGAPTPQFEEDFKQYVREAVRATKDYADSYIIGNEQDHTSYPAELRLPSSYARWCQLASEIIREEYPEAKILGYGLMFGDKKWFEDTIELGTHNYFDQAAVHTYSVFKTFEGQDFLGRIENYWSSVKEKFDVDLAPAWITEVGYFHIRHGGFAPYEISQQFPRLYIYAAASDLVDEIIDYAFLSTSPETYGHLRDSESKTLHDVEIPYAAWREYLTIACWNKNFGGDCDFVSSVDTENTRLYRFKRRSDAKDFAALWTLNGPENVTLDLGTNEISYMDILGNEEKMYSDDGRYTFNLSEDMKYIIGNFGKFEVLDEHKYNFEAFEGLEIISGVTSSVSVTVDGIKPEGYTISATDLMKADTAYTSKDGDNLSLGVTLSPIADGFTEKYLCGQPGRSQFKFYDKSDIRDIVSVDILKDGKLFAKYDIPLTAVEPVEVTAAVSPKSIEEINNWQMIYRLENKSDSLISGSFVLNQPSAVADTAKPVSVKLEPGEIREIKYSVPSSLVGQEIALGASFVTDTGTSFDFTDKQECFCAVYTDTPPQIDGTINSDEWFLGVKGLIPPSTYMSLIKTEQYSGADDLSGNVYMMWDKENLYLALKIKDDVHSQTSKDGSSWKGDGLQIGFTVTEKPTKFTHFMAALGDDGYITKHIYASEDDSNPRGRASDEDFDSAIVHKDGETTYEMRISWKLIMPMLNIIAIGDGAQGSNVLITDNARKEAKSGDTFRFSVLVNDNDGNGRKGYVEYGRDISGGNMKQFKIITLFGGEEK